MINRGRGGFLAIKGLYCMNMGIAGVSPNVGALVLSYWYSGSFGAWGLLYRIIFWGCLWAVLTYRLMRLGWIYRSKTYPGLNLNQSFGVK